MSERAQWIAFVVAVVGIGAALCFLEEHTLKPAPRPPSSRPARTDDKPPEPAPTRAEAFAQPPPAIEVETVMQRLSWDRQWAEGIQHLLRVFGGPEERGVTMPPAGSEFDGFPRPLLPPTPEGLVRGEWRWRLVSSSWGDVTHVEIKTPTGTLSLAANAGAVGATIRSEAVTFTAQRNGFLQWHRTRPVSLPAEAVLDGDDHRIELTALAVGAASDRQSVQTVTLMVRFVPHDALDPPTVVAESRKPSDRFRRDPFTGRVHFMGATPVQQVLVATNGRYLGCLVTSQVDLRTRLICKRTDSGQPVGRFLAFGRLFVAMANGHASLLVTLIAASPDDDFQFQVLSHSAASDPRKEVVLEGLGYLPTGQATLHPSKVAVDNWVRDLLAAFNTRFDDADLKHLAAHSQEGSRLARYLRVVEGEKDPDDAKSAPPVTDLRPVMGRPDWQARMRRFVELFAYSPDQIRVAAAQPAEHRLVTDPAGPLDSTPHVEDSSARFVDAVLLRDNFDLRDTATELEITAATGSTNRQYLVPNSERFLALAVRGDQPMPSRLRVRRLDSGVSIGTFSADGQMLVAFADGRTPLCIETGSRPTDGPIHCSVVALASSQDPRTAMFLKLLGHLLDADTRRTPGRKPRRTSPPKTQRQVDNELKWLHDALGADISAERLLSAAPTDPNVPVLIDYLRRLGLLK